MDGRKFKTWDHKPDCCTASFACLSVPPSSPYMQACAIYVGLSPWV